MDSQDVRQAWAELAGEYSPEYYAYYGPDEKSDAVLEALGRHLDRDAAVLELGCGSGRHLAHLADHGFADLSGVDINPQAFEVMAEQYPDLAADGTLHCGSLEEVLADFEDDAFDAVYSVETLQHLPPDDVRVLEDVVRVTGEVLVTVENEEGAEGSGAGEYEVDYVRDGLPLYHRNWGRVFTDLGLRQVEMEPCDPDVARTFRVTS